MLKKFMGLFKKKAVFYDSQLILSDLLAKGWKVKHKSNFTLLTWPGSSDIVFALPNGQEINPQMLQRINSIQGR